MLDYKTAKQLCLTLEDQGKKVIIPRRDSAEPYLVRYVIQRTPKQSVYIHRFLSSDDATLHDHPWDGSTTILNGAYTEEVMVQHWDGSWHKHHYRRVVGDHQSIEGNRVHRVQLDRIYTEDDWEAPMTLFITGPRYKSWGFYEFNGRNYKFTDHKDYLHKVTTYE